MGAVRKTIDGETAILILENPPVNALSASTRRELADLFREAIDGPAVRAIVLIGSERVFSGGGDITEFDGPIAEPDLPQLIGFVESSPKPVVAAIGAICFGGGLELAMAAHMRVALSSARLALPEAKLGLIPGAGGTQRLPRALGLEKALDLIVGGDTFAANAPFAGGLIDRLVDSDLLGSAVAFAREILAANAPIERLRDRRVKSASPAQTIIDEARRRHGPEAERFPAAIAAIDCLEMAVDKPIDEACRAERRKFLQLRETPTSRAMRYAFLAEREAAKVPGLSSATPTRPVERIAIIGAGTMGRGIAMAFLNAGLAVTLLDADAEALQRALAAIGKVYEASVAKGRMTDAERKERLGLVVPATDFTTLAGADLVIEAVFENMTVKEEVFRRVDALARPGAILATNTSTLNVDRIAAFTCRPGDVLGLHFFSPANIMKLLEVVRGKETSDEVLATALTLARRIGKVAVVAGVCDGFIGNRMLEHYVRMAHLAVEEGALPWQVDRALEAWGMAMGPFRMGDLAGNDIGWASRKRRYIERPHVRFARIGDRLCEHGRFGQKTGAGWYRYPDGRTPEPDADVEAIISDYRQAKGIVPRAIEDEEIVARCIYALVNEGARLLGEGIALRASDIDVVYLNGYGFPRFRGGPMHFAESVGLATVVEDMRRFHRAGGDGFWKPAPLLLVTLERGARLADAPKNNESSPSHAD